MKSDAALRPSCCFWLLAALTSGMLTGCNIDSWFDPSKQGYWETYSTSAPILERIDAIEEDDDRWGQTSDVMPEDLIPSDLTYRLVPGDVLTVQIFELYATGQWTVSTRRIDQGGFLRVPELGDIQAAGMTPQQLEEALFEILQRDYMVNPQVDILVEEGGGFTYTIHGSVPSPGMFTLRSPDLRLMEALSISGGTPNYTRKIYIIRQIPLSEEVRPDFERQQRPTEGQPPDEPVDIEELIEQLDEREEDGTMDEGDVSPGVLRQDGEPLIDIDDLEPVRAPAQPQVDVDDVQESPQAPQRPQQPAARPGGAWVYMEEQGEWVQIPAEDLPGIEAAMPQAQGEPPLYVERIIEIPYEPLVQGVSKYNIIIRPDDRIYVEPPPTGNIYIDGEISRPGVYNLPAQGDLTLSRFIAAAGGLGPLAIPDRVDLVRRVGARREATIRLNLGAIRHRTEPDVLLKPDDHIIIGTSFMATPLAVIRNGFRATYGFGFLLDRNFGNDVFGAPPASRLQGF